MASSSQPSDDDLIAQCLDGLDAAWEELLARYTPAIKGQIASMSWDGRLDHGDLFQLVCTRLYMGALEQFNPTRGSFSALLNRVTKNVVLDEWRKVRREQEQDLPFNEQIHHLTDHNSVLDETVLRSAIEEALRESPFNKTDFEIMTAIVNGWSKERVLSTYGISEATYYRRMASLRALLVPVLGPKKYSGGARETRSSFVVETNVGGEKK